MSGSDLPKVWHDFQAATEDGCLVLSLNGTQADVARLGLRLAPGLRLQFWCEDEDEHGTRDDLVAVGVVEYDSVNKVWLARLEDPGVEHESQSTCRLTSR